MTIRTRSHLKKAGKGRCEIVFPQSSLSRYFGCNQTSGKHQNAVDEDRIAAFLCIPTECSAEL